MHTKRAEARRRMRASTVAECAHVDDDDDGSRWPASEGSFGSAWARGARRGGMRGRACCLFGPGWCEGGFCAFLLVQFALQLRAYRVALVQDRVNVCLPGVEVVKV